MATPDPTPVHLSGDPRIDGLIEPSNWVTNGVSLVLTWSPHDFGDGHWTSSELNLVQQAFDTWSAVANITFVRVEDPGNFRNTAADLAVVATGTQLGIQEDAAGLAFTPDPFFTNFNLLGNSYTAANYPNSQGDIFIDDAVNETFSPGGHGFHVLIHEIGHALGLKHPHDPPNARTFDNLGLASRDNIHWTVMSYNNPEGEFPSLGSVWDTSPMPLDILAIQYIYGANMNWHTGDDIYALETNNYFSTIWDAGGIDTLHATVNRGVILRLSEGSFSTLNGNLITAVAYDTTLENAIGTNYADRIFGNEVDNVLRGENGNDFIKGGAGNDLLNGEAGGDQLFGDAGADELDGGGGSDSLKGGGAADLLIGDWGGDSLDGSGGDDILYGGNGDDLLLGGGGADYLEGGALADTLRGGNGTDVIIRDSLDIEVSGGKGVDTLVFAGEAEILDLSATATKVRGIEIFDISGIGSNELRLSVDDVLNLPSAAGSLVPGADMQILVLGDIDDRVVAMGPEWVEGPLAVVNGVNCVSYTAGDATLFVQSGVSAFLNVIPEPYLYPSGLDGATGYALIGANTGNFGRDVAMAGDVNGDGLSDMVIGDTSQNPEGGFTGSAYVVFGAGATAATVGVSQLNGTGGFEIRSGALNDGIGTAVSGAGDFNSDGFADIIVGAPYVGTGAGAAFVVYGSAAGFAPVLEVSELDGSNGFRISPSMAGGELGMTVGGAGDVNGDGLDDVVIGTRYGGGDIYVVFGQSSGIGSNLDISTLDGALGFRLSLSGTEPDEIAGAGDVNGDGFDDLIVGYKDDSAGGMSSGAAWVVFGKADWSVSHLALSSLDGSNGFRIIESTSYVNLGNSVSGAGDINADGFDDVIVGARGSNAGGTAAGEAVVIFGAATGFPAIIDAESLDGSAGFRIIGQPYDLAGFSVAGAGDINDDGYDDVIVGATEGVSGTITPGDVFVVFGHGGAFSDLTVGAVNGANGFMFLSDNTSDTFAFAVAGGSDVNGDGVSDMIVGHPGAFMGSTYSGAAYVVYGSSAPFTDALLMPRDSGASSASFPDLSEYYSTAAGMDPHAAIADLSAKFDILRDETDAFLY